MPPTADHLLAERDWMRALARTLVTDEHAAEDLVQDATVVALTNPPARANALRGWLRRVMHNLHLNRIRADGRRVARERAAPTARDVDGPEEVVQVWEMRRVRTSPPRRSTRGNDAPSSGSEANSGDTPPGNGSAGAWPSS